MLLIDIEVIWCLTFYFPARRVTLNPPIRMFKIKIGPGSVADTLKREHSIVKYVT